MFIQWVCFIVCVNMLDKRVKVSIKLPNEFQNPAPVVLIIKPEEYNVHEFIEHVLKFALPADDYRTLCNDDFIVKNSTGFLLSSLVSNRALILFVFQCECN